MNILSIVESVPRALATEALYYCVRALSQAGLPAAAKQDYFHMTSTSRPDPEAVALAREVLAHIERVEQADIDHMGQQATHAYIRESGEAVSTLIRRMDGYSEQRGRELLRELMAA